MNIPIKFKPIKIANRATNFARNRGICPKTLPRSPLKLPRMTNASTIPLQKFKLLINGDWSSLKPAKYATVTGRREIEHGPRLVNKPAKKTTKKVNTPGLSNAPERRTSLF